jgi:fructose-bisphosphate aldolase class I
MTIQSVAQALVGRNKGLLAMDESTATCHRRFASLNIPQTEAARHAWRTLLVTTPRLNTCISGAILVDETIRQSDGHGVSLVAWLRGAGIIPGIKVDRGTVDLALHPGETITEGLDGLRERLCSYATLGAGFAKWRAVLRVSDTRPSPASIHANAAALARYAALCQEAGLVAIVEPEVLMEGSHSLYRCGEVTRALLHAVFAALRQQSVAMDGIILKPNMILPGTDCTQQPDLAEVTAATLHSLRDSVPADVAGIAFLSGGQPDLLATRRLNALNALAQGGGSRPPWPMTFSFGRALQREALSIWAGEPEHAAQAQAALHKRALCNHAALTGHYLSTMEDAPPDTSR